MKLFVQPSAASKPKTTMAWMISIVLAAVFVVMAVAQLFTYEKYADVVAAMWLPGGQDMAPIWAAIIVVLEVAAAPFLLAMQLSLAARWVSMIAGWLTIALWLVVAVWQNTSTAVIANNGILGATIKLPIGWWSVVFLLALAVLAAWAAWGMWPAKERIK